MKNSYGNAEVISEVVGGIRKKSVVVIGGGRVVRVRLMVRVGAGVGGVVINGENFVVREIEKIIDTKQVRCRLHTVDIHYCILQK